MRLWLLPRSSTPKCSTSSYILTLNSAAKSKNRNAGLGVGDAALDGGAEEIADGAALGAAEGGLLRLTILPVSGLSERI